MNRSIPFTKMQGAGNDFVILDNRSGAIPREEYPLLAKELCCRRLSLGADGLMVVEAARNGGDYAMVFFNADGTLGEMCGNGARCIARYGHDHALAGDIQQIETTAGLVTGRRIAEDRYRIRLNDPSALIPVLSVTAKGRVYECAYTELGSPGIPHAIVHCPDWPRQDIDRLRELGRALRHSDAFPKGANVTFWTEEDANRFCAITFERGVEDFTLACGTGAGSTAAALRILGHTEADSIQLDFPGGTLWISLTLTGGKIHDIFLTGPAVTVAEGTVYLQ